MLERLLLELRLLRKQAEFVLYERLLILDRLRQAKEERQQLLEDRERVKRELRSIGFAPNPKLTPTKGGM